MKQYFIILFLIFIASLSVNLKSQTKADLNFAIVYPELTKEVLYKNDSSFIPTDYWELYFMSNHFKYELVNDNSIDEIHKDINVVIIPSLQVVTEDMIDKIAKVLKEGKGVLITGNFAAFDENGNTPNSDYLKKILDFRPVPVPRFGNISINHTLNGNTPLSIDLKPGTKVLLKDKPALYFASGMSDSIKSMGNYFPPYENFADTLSGIISYNKSAGRLLWFGFNLDQLIGEVRDKLLMNSFNWLSSKPLVFFNYFPNEYSSAVIIYRNIETEGDYNFKDSSYISGGINYFVSPMVYEKSMERITDINYNSNVNLLWDDFYFSNLNSYKKEEWLNRTKSSFKKITNQNYFGVSSFGGIYDSSNYKYLENAGYSFLFTSGYTESFSFNYDSVKNIYSFVNPSIPGTDCKSRLNFVLRNNGVLYINADSINSRNFYNVYLNNGKIWLTTFSDFLDWILKKDKVKLTYDFIDNELEINIKNNSLSDIVNTGVWISIPGISWNPYIKNSDETGELTYDSDKMMFRLKIDLIRGYDNIKVIIAKKK